MIGMRTLFWKIFLSFWIVQAAIIATTLLAFRALSVHPQPPGLQLFGDALALNGWNALQIYKRSGSAALDACLQELQHSSGAEIYILGPDGTAISSAKSFSPEERRIADLARRSKKLEFGGHGADAILARPIAASGDDSSYIMVARLPHPDVSPAPSMQQSLRDLAVAIAISGAACFLLARYLTAPIVRLRAAAQQLSKGDLTARAGRPDERRGDEIADLVGDFDQMATQIESLVHAQKQLMSDVSHELRSPLTRINLGLELMRKIDHPDVPTAIERLEQETERLNGMIGKLLVLSRVEAGEPLVEKTAVQIESLVRNIVADADFEARNRNRSVLLCEAEPCAVLGNAELLRSAFENIIRNAIRYTAEGTVVEVRLTVSSTPNDLVAKIKIRDHGPGVPDDCLEDLFRPFYRLDESRERKTGGVGLGLAIARRAIALHGGQVIVRNELEGGLGVDITLPTIASIQQ
jgi:two-component system sensor histidine kinase CpxA